MATVDETLKSAKVTELLVVPDDPDPPTTRHRPVVDAVASYCNSIVASDAIERSDPVPVMIRLAAVDEADSKEL